MQTSGTKEWTIGREKTGERDRAKRGIARDKKEANERGGRKKEEERWEKEKSSGDQERNEPEIDRKRDRKCVCVTS